MILRQFLHTEPVVAAAYLVGCGGRGVAAVIDPLEDFSDYVEAAEASNIAIKYVIDTHVHADHISGARALAQAVGAEYVLGPGAGARFAYREVTDDDILELGNVQLQVLHTPGHTPEHISLVAVDRTRGLDPWCVFTGHTLMVGDMGRTELASTAEDGARDLQRSAERLRGLADHVSIFPGAFSGSVCGRGLSGNPVSTVGFERRFGGAFSITQRDRFVKHMLQNIPERPARAVEIRAANLGLAPQAA